MFARVTKGKRKVRSPGGSPAFAGPECEIDVDLLAMPERKPLGAKKVYFPFEVLEVGRSFRTRRVVDTVLLAARRFRRSAPEHAEKKFVVARIDEGGYKARCWREK